MSSANRRLNVILGVIQELSGEELRAVPPQVFMMLLQGLTPEQLKTVLFMKNVKIFGGVNQYVDSFFDKRTVEQILAMPPGPRRDETKLGAIFILKNMLVDPALTQTNKDRVGAAIVSLEALVGGGARRKRSRRTRRRARN
jgi:hypothetical protein